MTRVVLGATVVRTASQEPDLIRPRSGYRSSLHVGCSKYPVEFGMWSPVRLFAKRSFIDAESNAWVKEPILKKNPNNSSDSETECMLDIKRNWPCGSCCLCTEFANASTSKPFPLKHAKASKPETPCNRGHAESLLAVLASYLSSWDRSHFPSCPVDRRQR